MTRFFIGVGTLVFALACGGTQDLDESNTDIGTAEQEISVGNGGFGHANSTLHTACAQPGTSSQNCFVPVRATKTFAYCFSGFSSQEKQELKGGVQNIDGQTNWTFIETTVPCDILFTKGTVGSASQTSFIDQFAKTSVTGTTGALTSPAGASHVNGTWTSFTKLSVIVDTNKSLTAYGTLAQFLNGHIGSAVAGMAEGLGMRSSSAYASTPMSWTANPNVSTSFLTAGDVCRANGYNGSSPTTISANLGCGT